MNAFFEFMPLSLCKKLHGLSISEAFQKNIISDLGDSERRFIFEDADQPEDHYAIIQEFLVKCSKRVSQAQNLDKIIYDLTFFLYEMNGVPEFRLCMPKYLKLGEAIYTLPSKQ